MNNLIISINIDFLNNYNKTWRTRDDKPDIKIAHIRNISLIPLPYF